jgi:glucans biosynthesis protein
MDLLAEAWIDDPAGVTLFQYVTDLAEARSLRPYRPRAVRVTQPVADLTYVQMRAIEHRRERAVWRGEAPFELQFFHPGGGRNLPVHFFLVEAGRSRPLPFESDRFNFGDEVQGLDLGLPEDAGYAGMRVLYTLNDDDRMDEVVSFLGASYFRLLGPGQVYGLSARGIALDVAGSGPEEFPAFEAFWVVRPESDGDELRIFALLDSPSLTGAYSFVLRPGEPASPADGSSDAVAVVDLGRPDRAQPTELEVEARLFARRDVRRLGIAPLTSMYLHGSLEPVMDDVRPRIHDSEGLLMRTSGEEWIWRPLTNRPQLRITSLRDIDPPGFGLAQRTRAFSDYLDLEARYHSRPSLWVDVDGAWGAGGVELVEIPTNSEFFDNIVAYFAPDEPLAAGDTRSYRYRLVTFDADIEEVESISAGRARPGRVVRTRIGQAGLPGQSEPPPPERRRILVDFAGAALSALAPETVLGAYLSASSGSVTDLRVELLPGGGRRATFLLDRESGRPADLRLLLTHADTAVTETWSYLVEDSR